MQTYTIFAGVNGAGKTSIYKSIYYNENKDEKRINTDEMVAILGSWQDSNLQLRCAREAVKLIRKYISEGISFNQETTLAGRSIIRNIEMAKQKGYYVVVNYIGVSNPEVAKERVRIRVKNGGHGIPDEDIERRYYDSIENLKKILNICDEINIYDNTEMFKEIIDFENGKIKWIATNLPEWTRSIIER